MRRKDSTKEVLINFHLALAFHFNFITRNLQLNYRSYSNAEQTHSPHQNHAKLVCF